MTVLSDKTSKTYATAIDRMENRPVPEAIAWIKSQEWSDSYKKLYLSALKYREEQAGRTAPATIATAIKQLSTKVQAVEKSQKLSEKEKDKYVTWDEIQTASKAMDDSISAQDRLIVSLYTETAPVRNDYTPMMVLYKTPTKAVIAAHKGAGHNLCVLLKRNAYFLFLNYKTAEKYDDRKIAIPTRLANIIRARNIPSGDFLLSVDGQAMTEKYLSAKIQRIFQKLLGKSVSINILRHAYVTKMREGEMSLANKEKLAYSMMHSPLENELTGRFSISNN
jgi:uncharacterized protein YdaT